MIDTRRRTGAETRALAQRVALSLFSSQGYEATSLRQIADQLGINKASLYYHFASKEEIVRSVFTARAAEVQELLDWTSSQPATPDLLERVVLRWVDSQASDKLLGIRFLNANPVLLRSIADGSGAEIGDRLEALVARFTRHEDDASRIVLIRMAFLSINAAVSAAAGTPINDEQVLAAARESACAILDRLGPLGQRVSQEESKDPKPPLIV
jgi:AcrR family transcriptional regulator